MQTTTPTQSPDPAATPSVTDTVDPWRVASSRAIHPSSHNGDEPLVAVIAAGLAAVSIPWEIATGTTPTERRYELLLATEQYDAWLIHWPAGTGLEAHDHGGSIGAFAVVDGTLDEDVVADGVTSTRRFAAGDTATFDGDHVHAVVNRSGAGATSVHVYSPPLQTMGFYRRISIGTNRRSTGSNRSTPADPTVGADPMTRAPASIAVLAVGAEPGSVRSTPRGGACSKQRAPPWSTPGPPHSAPSSARSPARS